jgi:hypothetical protein
MRKALFILLAGLLGAATWLWVQRIAIPHQQEDAAARGVPRGNLSDLYPRWFGARELLLRHRDPYGAEITREIQVGYYGRALDASRPNDPRDQQAFAYPVYVALPLAPTIGLPFPVVQRGFLYLVALLTAMSVLMWLEALDWTISLAAKVAVIVLVLGCFPAIQGLKLQQLTLLVAALLAASMRAVVRKQFVWAGILLAFTTIKPQLAVLPVAWLAVWTIGNWSERRRLARSFGVTLTVLVILGEILLPGWVHEFYFASQAYYRYTGGGRSVLDVLLSPTLGRALAAVVVASAFALLWHVRRAKETAPEFRWALALILATTLVVIPMFAPYNQLLLLPCLMVTVRDFEALWRASALCKFFVVVTAFSVLWPWLASGSLLLAALLLSNEVAQKAWALPLYTSLAIPITILGTLYVGRNALLSGDARPTSA